MAISLDFFVSPRTTEVVPTEIQQDPRFYPYFKDIVGAVDCIHIPVMVGVDEQGPFRDKNGQLSQTVLAACSFDRKFHYVLAGWEGSASEARVLNSAITRRNKFQVPQGKYYLVDTKYTNTTGFMAPYHDVSYHNSSESSSLLDPQEAKELFNQSHSLLRNAIDGAFGALKARFPILTSAPSYPLLVVTACAILNYTLSEKSDNWIFNMFRFGNLVQMQLEEEA